MSELGGESTPQPQPAAPFVTVTLSAKGEEIQTNLPPTQRPMILWLLRRAEQIVLTQPSEQEKAAIVKPQNGMAGILKRMGR